MSARTMIAAALRVVAPATWTVLDDAPVAVDRLDVGRLLVYVTPDTVAPGPLVRTWATTLDVTVITGETVPAAADDALDDALVRVVAMLDTRGDVDTWTAERLVVAETWHALTISFAVLTHTPTLP